jgi:hypothetical protein
MAQEISHQYVQRLLGGPIGLDPWNIIESVRRLIQQFWNMGFDAVRWLWQYFLLGAVIVLPIWFLVRLVKAPRGQ